MSKWRKFKQGLDDKQVQAPLSLVILLIILAICALSVIGLFGKFAVDQVNAGDASAKCRAAAGAQRDLILGESFSADRAVIGKEKEALHFLANGRDAEFKAAIDEMGDLIEIARVKGAAAQQARQDFVQQVQECG